MADQVPIPQTMANLLRGGERSGYVPRDWSQHPYGFESRKFDLPLIDESEWMDRTNELMKAKRTNRHLKQRYNITPLHQGSTNYCWNNGPTMALHYLQARTGSGVRRLSAASVGARVTNFRNVGGYGTQALLHMRKNGINFESDWPANSIQRNLATEENDRKARQNLVLEWIDFPYQGTTQRERLQFLMSALLNSAQYTVSTGHNWWRHQVLLTTPWIHNGKLYIIADNSGRGRDKNGETMLTLEQATYDDAVCPTVLSINEVT